jgi:hypothetical protein
MFGTTLLSIYQLCSTNSNKEQLQSGVYRANMYVWRKTLLWLWLKDVLVGFPPMPLVLLCSGKVEWVRRRPQVRRRTAPSSSTSTRPVVRAIHGCISSRWPPRPPLNCIFVLCIYALSHMSILPWTRGRQQEAVARRSVAAWLSPSSSPHAR